MRPIPCLAMLAAIAAAPAWADSLLSKLTEEPQVEMKDGEFFVKAAQAGIAEVAAGKLAVARAKNAEVKAFAQKMVADHSQANDDLQILASKKGVTLPEEMDAGHKQALDGLEHKTGEDFDRAYVGLMQKAHREAVDLFKDAAREGKDADVKAFAAQTLPKLEHHKQMADGLNKHASR